MAIRHGGKELTPKEQKAQVLKWTGWTTTQYNKEYDKLRNRVRAFERATDKAKGEINVADLLAKDARSQYYARYYGETYTPTNLYQAVAATPSISSGKKLSRKTAERVQNVAKERLQAQYRGLLSNSAYSAQIGVEIGYLDGWERATVQEIEEIINRYSKLSTLDRQAALDYNKNRRDFREPPRKVDS